MIIDSANLTQGVRIKLTIRHILTSKSKKLARCSSTLKTTRFSTCATFVFASQIKVQCLGLHDIFFIQSKLVNVIFVWAWYKIMKQKQYGYS